MICKIWNLVKIRIKIENEIGKIEDVFIDDFNLLKKLGVKKFKRKIVEYIDMILLIISIKF